MINILYEYQLTHTFDAKSYLREIKKIAYIIWPEILTFLISMWFQISDLSFT